MTFEPGPGLRLSQARAKLKQSVIAELGVSAGLPGPAPGECWNAVAAAARELAAAQEAWDAYMAAKAGKMPGAHLAGTLALAGYPQPCAACGQDVAVDSGTGELHDERPEREKPWECPARDGGHTLDDGPYRPGDTVESR